MFDTWIKEKVWDTTALYLCSRSSCGQCKPISSALCKVHCWNRHGLGPQWSKGVCYRQAEKKEQKEKKFKPLWIGVSFIAVKMQPRMKNKETEIKIATTKAKKSLPKKKRKTLVDGSGGLGINFRTVVLHNCSLYMVPIWMRLLVWIFQCPVENQISGLNLGMLFTFVVCSVFPNEDNLTSRRGSSIIDQIRLVSFEKIFT